MELLGCCWRRMITDSSRKVKTKSKSLSFQSVASLCECISHPHVKKIHRWSMKRKKNGDTLLGRWRNRLDVTCFPVARMETAPPAGETSSIRWLGPPESSERLSRWSSVCRFTEFDGSSERRKGRGHSSSTCCRYHKTWMTSDWTRLLTARQSLELTSCSSSTGGRHLCCYQTISVHIVSTKAEKKAQCQTSKILFSQICSRTLVDEGGETVLKNEKCLQYFYSNLKKNSNNREMCTIQD